MLRDIDGVCGNLFGFSGNIFIAILFDCSALKVDVVEIVLVLVAIFGLMQGVLVILHVINYV